jgi:hypothetical protein
LRNCAGLAAFRAGRLRSRVREENFLFVNVAPRRLWSRRGGFEGARDRRERRTRLAGRI